MFQKLPAWCNSTFDFNVRYSLTHFCEFISYKVVGNGKYCQRATYFK